jgi:hypothetical protein
MKILLTLLIFTTCLVTATTAQQNNYDVIPGNGNGLRFWQSDTYKIHMGNNGEYVYGPVTDYSIKMNMNNDPARGWTWGVSGQTPIAALNTLGNMKIAGSLDATGQISVRGVPVIVNQGNDVYANVRVLRNASTQFTDGMYIGYLGSGGPLRFFSNSGTTEFMTLSTSGNLGIGTTTPRGKLDVDGPGDIYLADDTDAGAAQSLYLPGHIFISPHAGSNISYLQARRQNNSGTTSLRLRTYNNGTLTEAMHIEGNGNVGIGTTNLASSRQVRLCVFEPGSSASTWRGRVVSSGETSAVVMGEWNGKACLAAHNPTLDGWSDLYLQHGGGNIGIGTQTATQKLEVNGNILQNSENTAIGIDAQPNARLGFIKKSGTVPMIASDISAPIIFAQTNQSGIHTNIATATLTERMRIATNGNVGIGTSNPTQKLTVNGIIYGKEVKVNLSVPGPDYVFESDYDLRSLKEIKNYIDQHKHLPEVPSAKEMQTNGINVGEMNMILLKKIEELTLYMLEQQKQLDAQQKEIQTLKLQKK